MRAIALISGGLDSVVAAWVARSDADIAVALTFDYGQRAAAREIQAAGNVAQRLGCEHIVIELPWLGKLGQSALTDVSADVPEIAPDQLDDADRTEKTAAAVWVPNRNGVFLNVAAAYAEALDCDAIVCGFNREEAATFPDNSREFMTRADRFFEFSTQRKPRVLSPTVDLSKTEIVELATATGAPIDLVWSCYFGGDEHCWRCESCRRLQRALESAGVWADWNAGRLD